MSRRLAMQGDGMWTGTVDTEPHATSGWHHHGDYETTLYIVSGRMRMESGPGGRDVVEAGPGGFPRGPARAGPPASDPSPQPGPARIVRGGNGPPPDNPGG